jgi:hypothetical protein
MYIYELDIDVLVRRRRDLVLSIPYKILPNTILLDLHVLELGAQFNNVELLVELIHDCTSVARVVHHLQ